MITRKSNGTPKTAAPRVLDDLTAAAARIAELEALLAAKSAPRALSVKMSDKGAISVYGLGRFPTTLYRDQWTRLAEFVPNVQKFIAANAAALDAKQKAYDATRA